MSKSAFRTRLKTLASSLGMSAELWTRRVRRVARPRVLRRIQRFWTPDGPPLRVIWGLAPMAVPLLVRPHKQTQDTRASRAETT